MLLLAWESEAMGFEMPSLDPLNSAEEVTQNLTILAVIIKANGVWIVFGFNDEVNPDCSNGFSLEFVCTIPVDVRD
jgi:hypothetical protein